MQSINMAFAYGVTTVLALLLAVGYCALVKKKELWLMFLHVSVVVVNLGYFALSISGTLAEALLANRISYLGSVFLPLCMLMTIVNVCRLNIRKWGMGLLLLCSVAVFLLAASPGYSDLYYQDVELVFVNGMAMLEKVYGPLHPVYLVYLLAYFGMMIGVILRATMKKTTVAQKHAILLLTIVLLNIAIWFVEQLVYSEFEFLSVSYIISELLLIMLYGMLQDYGISWLGELPPAVGEPEPVRKPLPEEHMEPETEEEISARLSDACIAALVEKWGEDCVLTGRERDVLGALLRDKKRKDIAAEMCVTEHTVKKHTGNVFSKLGVTNRGELFAMAEAEQL